MAGEELGGEVCGFVVVGGAGGWLNAGHGSDAFALIADVCDLDTEVLAEFDGVAVADLSVVDEEVEFFVGGLGEFDDHAGDEGDDIADGHAAFAEADDDGDFEGEDLIGSGHGFGLGFGLL